jgi:hypothetical protein
MQFHHYLFFDFPGYAERFTPYSDLMLHWMATQNAQYQKYITALLWIFLPIGWFSSKSHFLFKRVISSQFQGQEWWNYTPLPHTSSWRSAKLISHRDSFTFTFTELPFFGKFHCLHTHSLKAQTHVLYGCYSVDGLPMLSCQNVTAKVR